MKKQTAVEWLEEKLKTYCLLTISIKADFEQAKAMEKEQIVDALKYSYKRDYFTPNFREQQELFEQYYNETYGGDK